jgi:hypothetical protein
MKNSTGSFNLKSSDSFKNLGNSIVSSRAQHPNTLNSFTVKKKLESPSSLNPIREASYKSQTPRNQPSRSSNFSQSIPRRSPSLNQNSIRYLKRKIEATAPPGDLQFSVFAIYENGNSYDRGRRAYGMPKGMGVLLNENLCLTAASVFKDESDVINSFIQLRDGSIFRFDPYRAFASLEGLFAIVGFRLSEVKVLQSFKPVDIRQNFDLSEGDEVSCFPLGLSKKKVVLTVSDSEFSISSGKPEFILPGNPIFTVDWVMQGLFLSSEGHINRILRLSVILDHLNQSIYLAHNHLIDKFAHQHDQEYVEKFNNRVLYYFEWGSQNIWRYDIDLKSWENVKIHNRDDFTRSHPLWAFGVNSRLVYLPDFSIACIGGHSLNTQVEMRDLFFFKPQEFHTLVLMAEMIVPRSGPACVFCDGYIWAFGGNPHPKTCEKYSIKSNKWIPVASMFYPRTDATASSALMNEYIFVVGGEPFSPAGTSVERYSIKFNHWELLSVTLPKPMSKIGIFPISNRRLALMGGTESSHIFLLTINESLSFDGIDNSSDINSKTLTLQDCFRPLEDITETVFPIAFCRASNTLFLMNSSGSDPSSLSFSIIEFNVEYFDITTPVDHSSKPLEMISKVRTPYDLGRPWRNDSHLRLLK